MKIRLIVALTGSSGVIYGIRTLEALKPLPDVETHVVLSSATVRTLKEESDFSADYVNELADYRYGNNDIGAPIASGSFRAAGMLVAPCSVKTLSGIANCYSDNLISRAADVCLKERRKLVLLFRETPLHASHINLMQLADRSGAIIMPPVPAFYHRPKSIDDIVNHTVGRMLDLVRIEAGLVQRWKDTDPAD